ncbi:GntR family transcriptional regulator [Pelagibacterium lacus]|uniref:GntR family transcriptional regulator n=1 Tax=Pelagibacterium lacus TaxID=2282655 RepID=A0A369W253_9HYPH|nr:GntR family transcriptional regulator [Pelagibacterium lacus]RDE08109.1 GntR family transcriptional regulator [Pelagibacterium lacus]
MSNATLDKDGPGGPASKATGASIAFLALRRDILTGALKPGQRLKIEDLRQAYNYTANPMREALNRLAAEGLVNFADQRGFSVAAVSLAEWREIVRARCLVESCVLRESIQNRTNDWEDEIVLSLHRLTRTSRFAPGDQKRANPDWETNHHRFHRALLANCNSSILLDFCEELREKSDRYRHIASISPQARTSYDEEHTNIAKAAMDGNAETATALLERHYRMTLTVVEEYFRE